MKTSVQVWPESDSFNSTPNKAVFKVEIGTITIILDDDRELQFLTQDIKHLIQVAEIGQ